MDMVSSIKECAERVLGEVAKSERINLLSIAGHLGERSLLVYESIGWLAREERIRFLQEGNQVYVALPNGKPAIHPSQEKPAAP